MRFSNVVWAASVLLAASSARAETTRFYNLEGFGSFLDGNPESTAVTEDGMIALPPVARERFADTTATFSAATAMGDDLVVAKVGEGRVLAVDRAGKARELAKIEGQIITALVATDFGLLAAVGQNAASPATLYKVANGKATSFATLDAGYVWSMVNGPKGVVYAAAGEPGKVYKIDASGKPQELFKSDQEHLKSITWVQGLGLFVGGGERGILYRSTDEKAFRALYDSGHPEITSIAARGSYAYVAAVSGADSLASEEGNEQQRGGKGGKPSANVRSQLVRVGMDGSAETLAGSNDEAIFALAFDEAGRLIAATGATGRDDPRGRLYAVDTAERTISMIYQAASRRITHLVTLPSTALAAVAAAGGRIVQLTGQAASKGEFFTLPFDTGINSSFGVLQVFGTWPTGTKVTAAARSGQTATPDATWSEWSKEMAAPGGQRVAVPNGRYVQVRVTLTSDGKQSPIVNRVRLAYLRQNLPPFVREVVALRKGIALLPLPREEQKSKTVSLAEKANEEMRRGDGDGPRAGGQMRARQIEQRGALTVRWVAEDPNGDDLRYDLQFRSVGRKDWRVLEKDLEESFYTVQSAQLPDGHYQFRVRASDSPSNPSGQELDDDRESASVLVDNSPPKVDSVKVDVSGRRATARVIVVDNVGPVMNAEYAVDGGEFRPMAPDDGVLDGAGETFTLRLGELESGQHTVTVRVLDEADNEGFGEATFSVP